MSKLIYLGSPYSSENEEMRIKRFEGVSKKAAQLCADGHVVFSPITYGHTLVGFREMPTDWEFWKNFCLVFLEKCDELVVYKMFGWELSKGLAAEIEYAKQKGIPITYIY